jgi:hypothetical protein
MEDGEMQKNYARMGWAWPVDPKASRRPRYVMSWCPFCFGDLPPILSGNDYHKILDALWPNDPQRFPEWMLKRKPNWQADGEGDE